MFGWSRAPEEPELDPDLERVAVVARDGERVIEHREKTRRLRLEADIESLKLVVAFVADELRRDSPGLDEACILLLKQRVGGLERHWREMTLAAAAADLAAKQPIPLTSLASAANDALPA